MANSFTITTYSPQDVILNIGGYKIGGWESISVSKTRKGFVPIPGIRGKNTRIRNTDTSATLLVTLMATSATNDVFSQIHSLDLTEGTARITLTLKDTSGSSVFSSTEAYITGYPTISFTNKIESRVWEIFAQSSKDFQVGGNTRPSTSLFDSAVNEASSFVSNLFN